ncbi:phage portal protein [Amycolatopsis dendrobii]|uniref:Phage portal protein n=1 Tax=Amycolatopsis dendrobii TaxID=2760662 RepID=A0A7W3VVR0_9PSEU|nr:phage portal protein [Amycolatopsis dendrobii]MBB1153512.1 phage portal protein [Amycolatopsis dendrobii]
MLSRTTVVELVKDQMFPGWLDERERLDRIDRWYRWTQDDIKLPRRATPELRALAEMSKIPWLGLVVTSVSQCMYVDGYRSPLDASRPDGEVSPAWKTWHSNGFDQRQVAVHRAALAYGYSYVRVLPGEDHEGKRSVMRGVSPRKCYALYQDPADDDWPMYVIQVAKADKGGYLISLFDEEDVHYVSMDSSTSKPEWVSAETHGAGVTPFVRYSNMLDLEGRSAGEVEPFIPAAARVNKTSFDRLVTQHFSSWKVRTVSGMAQPDTEEEANRKKLQLRQEDLLVAEDPDTRFGTLDESPLTGFIDSWRSDVEALAAVTQTPTHTLTGQLVNLSAEALAAARAGLTQKVAERQKSFGRSHGQTLRLSALLEGHEDEAHDVLARVTWQDMEVRSIAQAVDAWGKAATMLQVPVQALWQRLPGVEKSDVDEWERMAEQADPVARMTKTLADQANPVE